MELKNYFEERKGLGVLATSNDKGKVNVAVYARPHIIDENTLAFIMRERRSHDFLKSNPRAAYLFREDGDGYNGVRLCLSKLNEEVNSSLIEEFRRRQPASCPKNDDSNKYLVYFKIDEVRPLIGDTESEPDYGR